MSGMFDTEKEKVDAKINEAKQKMYTYDRLKTVAIIAFFVGAILGNMIAK